MTKRRRDEVAVGLFVTIAIIVGIAGTLWLARRGFTKSYPMYALFPWGSNLKQGQPVNLAGVQVGYVDNVDLEPAGYLVVKMSINREMKIPEGTTATVANEGFFGDKSIALTPCSANARGPLPSADTAGARSSTVPVPSCRFVGFLPPGDTIPTGRAAPSMDQLMMRVDTVSQVLTEMTRTFRAEFVQAGGFAELRRTVASTNQLVTELNRVAAEQSRQLSLTLTAFRRTASAIDSAVVDSTVRNMQQTTQNLAALTANLQQTTGRMNDVMAQLQTGNGTAAKFLNDPGVYNNLRELLARLDSLTADIKANPKRYINVKVF